jgi:hypothetical protein
MKYGNPPNNIVGEWLKSSIGYGRSLLDSGFEGARSTGGTALAGEPIASVLSRSARRARRLTTIGACVGVLGAYLPNRRRPLCSAALGWTLVGAAIGFSTGMAWETRRLTGAMARGAMRNMGSVRDAHWLERNPITYA